MWFLPELRLGLGYLVVTALVLVAYVRRRSLFRTVSPDMTAAQGLVFYRHLLERERISSGQRALVHHWSRAEYHRAQPGLYQQSAFPRHRGEIAVMALILATHAIVLTLVAGRMGEEARRYQTELEAVGG